jgi:peptidyl-prolyl cis-trans isomerase C
VPLPPRVAPAPPDVGSKVHARHICVKSEDGEIVLGGIKRWVERRVAEGLANFSPHATPPEREKARVRLLEEAFATAARQNSTCPSKERDGDLGWFGRSNVDRTFSRAALALKPFEVSAVVRTSQGFHLILVVDRKEGKDDPWDDPPPR